MGLKARILHTVSNNLMMAFSTALGAWLMLKALPWLIGSGILPMNVVMK